MTPVLPATRAERVALAWRIVAGLMPIERIVDDQGHNVAIASRYAGLDLASAAAKRCMDALSAAGFDLHTSVVVPGRIGYQVSIGVPVGVDAPGGDQ